MITSIFLLFVAFGVTLAALIYGLGGIFPILVALSIMVIVIRMISQPGDKPEHDLEPVRA